FVSVKLLLHILDLYSFPTRRSSDLLSLKNRHKSVGVVAKLPINGESRAYSSGFSGVVRAYTNDPWQSVTRARRCRFRRCGCAWRDRKSTRLNSSHRTISYAVFCLKK